MRYGDAPLGGQPPVPASREIEVSAAGLKKARAHKHFLGSVSRGDRLFAVFSGIPDAAILKAMKDAT